MFTDMRNGTARDWAHIAAEHGKHIKSVAARQIMDSLARLESIEVGFAANQLTHSLMAGTLARRSGASDEEVVAALCHDLGKLFSIPNHGPIAAEMLKPYVREDIYHAVYWHQEFQGRYYFEHLGKDPEGAGAVRGRELVCVRPEAGRRLGRARLRSRLRRGPAGELRAGGGAGVLESEGDGLARTVIPAKAGIHELGRWRPWPRGRASVASIGVHGSRPSPG